MANSYMSQLFAQGEVVANRTAKLAMGVTKTEETKAADVDGSVIYISNVDASIKSQVEKLNASIQAVYSETLYQLLSDHLNTNNKSLDSGENKLDAIINTYAHELDKLTTLNINQTRYLRRRIASKYRDVSDADANQKQLEKLQQQAKLVISLPGPEIIETPVNPKLIVARLGAFTIHAAQIEDLRKLKLFQLRGELYLLRKRSLEKLVDQALLERAAKTQGVSLIELENSLRNANAPDRDIEAFMQSQKELGKSVDRNKAISYINYRFRYGKREQLIRSQRGQANIKYLLYVPVRPLFHIDKEIGVEYGASKDEEKVKSKREPDIVLFSNYNCDVCRQSYQQIEKLLSNNPKLIVKQYDFMQLTDTVALDAALLANCANRQGKYQAMKNYFLTSPPPSRNKTWLDNSQLNGFLSDNGIEPEPFHQCINDVAVQQKIDDMSALANKIGFDSAPAYLLRGIPISGFQTSEELRRKLDKNNNSFSSEVGEAN